MALETTAVAPALTTASGNVRAGAGARLAAMAALAAFVSGVGYVAAHAYHLMTDALVAPLILSPDNDLVIQSKLSLSRLLAERNAIVARTEQNRAAIEAAERGLERLQRLRQIAARALEWSAAVTDHQTALGQADLARLSEQRTVVDDMTRKQEDYVRELERGLAAGLVRRSDLAREENTLSELRVSALQTDRNRLATEAQLHNAALTQEALRRRGSRGAVATPEMLVQKDQLVRIEMDLLKLNSELRGKRVQARADEDELTRIDELVAQMKSRPIFRAIESSQNVAFVPYTQLDGVHPGGAVLECKVWGMFACRRVGSVAQVLPGEVAAQDPWGTPTRGQYAILELSDARSARAKSLHVRP